MNVPKPSLPADFGKYVLLERLAAGGMAEVYRAVLRGAAGFQKPVALKRILPFFSTEPDFVALFQDEARIASTLAHTNVTQVFDFGEVDGSYYLALELVDGTDLARLTDRLRTAGQPMPVTTAAFIAAEAARGLAYAHEKRGQDGEPLGIVHRDVSPQNILLSYAGEVKVTDFGIAKAAGKAHKTATGVVMGKLKYMSPEQVAGVAMDPRSDVFSLGVILYELLTGGPIFPGEQTLRLAELIHSAVIPPPSTRAPGIPPELDAIVLRSLAREPSQRHVRAADLARDLTVFVQREAPGFTREDLAALVTRLVPAAGPTIHGATPAGTAPAGTAPAGAATAAAAPAGTAPAGAVLCPAAGTNSVAMRDAVTVADRHLGPKARALVSATGEATTPDDEYAETVAAEVLPGLPDGTVTSADPAFGAAAGTALRQLDIATCTRLPSEGPVPRRPVAHGFAKGTAQRQPRRRLSGEAWIGIILGAIILASGSLIIVRVALPGPESAPIGSPPPGGSAQAGVEAPPELPGLDATAALAPDAAVGLGGLPLPSPSDALRKELLQRAERFDQARRGVRTAEYTTFLTALDWRVAVLEVLPDGRPAPGELPAWLADRVDAQRVGDAVDATLAYVAATGELPPLARTALNVFLKANSALAGPLVAPQLSGPLDWSAAALTAFTGPANPARLEDIAAVNATLGRFCAPASHPRVRRVPYLCELPALVAQLRATDPTSPTAAALERWSTATNPIGLTATLAGTGYRIAAATWQPPAGITRDGRPASAKLELDLEAIPASSSNCAVTATYAILAGGLDTPRPATPTPVGAADELGGSADELGRAADGAARAGETPGRADGEPKPGPYATHLRLVFSLPTRLVAPVLAVTCAHQTVYLRVPPGPL